MLLCLGVCFVCVSFILICYVCLIRIVLCTLSFRLGLRGCVCFVYLLVFIASLFWLSSGGLFWVAGYWMG